MVSRMFSGVNLATAKRFTTGIGNVFRYKGGRAARRWVTGGAIAGGLYGATDQWFGQNRAGILGGAMRGGMAGAGLFLGQRAIAGGLRGRNIGFNTGVRRGRAAAGQMEFGFMGR